MAKKNGRRRSPEEAARREKIRELLALADVNGMEDIRQLFRETIAEFIGQRYSIACETAALKMFSSPAQTI